jgi:hypothetical protein
MLPKTDRHGYYFRTALAKSRVGWAGISAHAVNTVS